ncbi:MAG: hypothetical protein IJA04_05575 [Bacteroidaceae bacterium]|nr:hypothetical protein [Bacteroidaceae bacterium]
MKNLSPLLACFVALLSCSNQNSANKVNDTNPNENIEAVSNEQTTSIVTDTLISDTTEIYTETSQDIRFAGWEHEQWIDNEYIRTVRKFIDAYNNGEIEDASLDEYKDYIKGKFVIGDIKPSIMGGGAFIYIIFLDYPEKIFTTMVNSSIDEETKEVYDYCCMGLKLEDYESGYTQEDIKRFLKEHPEHKMW